MSTTASPFRGRSSAHLLALHRAVLDAAFAGVRRVPQPVNDPNRSYAPGTPERAELKARLKAMAAERIEIPLVIGGREIRTGRTGQAVMPHDHSHVLAEYHMAGRRARPAGDRRVGGGAPRVGELAVGGSRGGDSARRRAAGHDAGGSTIVAATMLGQSKTAFQAEIDAASEMIDFWRFNTYFAQELYSEQPVSSPGMWNQMEYRALEGFVYAVTPFNFTAIGGNLTTAPALMGNTVVWKPAATRDAERRTTRCGCSRRPACRRASSTSCPATPCRSRALLLDSPELAGVHFTGSTAVFNSMWKKVGENIDRYRGYPRLVGETGGKDFIVAHPSADPAAVAVAIARGGFEYQGQKCSAASRVYIPESLWDEVRDRTIAMMKEITDGRRPRLPQLRRRGHRQEGVHARSASTWTTRSRTRGSCRAATAKGEHGYFIEPTLIQTEDPGLPHACARRSSARSSPRTSIPTRSGRRRSPWSIGRRRTR